jgi:predicted CXXCH cytochrome family protein
MTNGFRRFLIALAAFVATATPAAAQIPGGTPSDLFRDDVHAQAGLTCDSCHGKAPSGEYRSIARTEIAPLCSRCHSDAAYMRRFRPQLRVDQYAQYLTSTHGKRMSSGETRVATCSDCHGGHGIRPVQDARSPVAPARVATTCARCHSDAARMTAFGHHDNPPVDWGKSVHAKALLERGDTSAPTCSTCHGSHGAVPPGVTSVALICSQCHVREAELFRKSPKKALFESLGQAECLTCHSNHEIEAPADSWIGLKDPALCSTCHDDSVKGAADIVAVQDGLQRLSAGIDRARIVLDRAEQAGMLVDEGRLVLREAHERQILARVTVHAFSAKPFTETASPGVAEAARAEAIGAGALQELQFRRKGLAVATVLIVGFLVTLWVKIRRLPPIEP